MNFRLYYSGYEGDFSATLYEGDNCIGSETGLKSVKACEKWGKSTAALHKMSNTAPREKHQAVSVNGHEHFTL